MSETGPDIIGVKQKMKSAWMAGDFGVIGRYAEEAEHEFVERLGLKPGMKVLDVGCGTGNTAIPAAKFGAEVIGVDIAMNLLEQARVRAEKAGVKVDFLEGDAEELNFPDNSFDVIISMFGAMFAPRPERVASEFLRVCKHGGTIAMGNWIPSGFIGKMFATSARHAPPPPGVPAPSLWGDEATVRQRFDHGAADVSVSRIEIPMKYPFPPQDVVQLFKTYFGPTKVAFARLDEAAQKAFHDDLVALYDANNRAKDGTTDVPAEYLQVYAVKR